MVPFQFQFFETGVEDLYNGGVRVGPNAPTSPDENPIVTFYESQFEGSDITAAQASNVAQFQLGLEVVHGSIQDTLPSQERGFSYPEKDSDFVYEININRLTEIARKINAAAGVEVHNIGDVRRGLIAMQNDIFAARGMNQPYGAPGNQNAYRDEVSRKVENGAEKVFEWATDVSATATTKTAKAAAGATGKLFTW